MIEPKTEARFTLSLPPEIYQELKGYAEAHNLSLKEVVRQALKFGLVAIKISEDPNADLFIKEKVTEAGQKEAVVKETRLKFIW